MFPLIRRVPHRYITYYWTEWIYFDTSLCVAGRQPSKKHVEAGSVALCTREELPTGSAGLVAAPSKRRTSIIAHDMTPEAIANPFPGERPPPADPGMSRLQTLFVLAVGLTVSVATLLELPSINGAAHWRNIGLAMPTAALLGPLLAIGWVLWCVERARHSKWLLLGVLAGSNFLLQVLGIWIDPRGTGLIEQIIRSPVATSYFGNALEIHGMSAWLRHFHEVALGGIRSSQHPAGPVVFCWILIRLFGPFTAAPVCGYALGLAGAVGVLVIHAFAGLWTPGRACWRASSTPLRRRW